MRINQLIHTSPIKSVKNLNTRKAVIEAQKEYITYQLKDESVSKYFDLLTL